MGQQMGHQGAITPEEVSRNAILSILENPVDKDVVEYVLSPFNWSIWYESVMEHFPWESYSKEELILMCKHYHHLYWSGK